LSSDFIFAANLRLKYKNNTFLVTFCILKDLAIPALNNNSYPTFNHVCPSGYKVSENITPALN
jgi:hypothetical protein